MRVFKVSTVRCDQCSNVHVCWCTDSTQLAVILALKLCRLIVRVFTKDSGLTAAFSSFCFENPNQSMIPTTLTNGMYCMRAVGVTLALPETGRVQIHLYIGRQRVRTQICASWLIDPRLRCLLLLKLKSNSKLIFMEQNSLDEANLPHLVDGYM